VRELPQHAAAARRAAENGASALFVHAPSSAFLGYLMYVATQTGSVLALTPLCATVFLSLWRRAQGAAATFWLMAIVGAATLDFVAAQGFTWLRPAPWIPRIRETTYSFPSGHTMAGRWRWTSLVSGAIFVAMVGASRVYFGLHYPSDVLAGWAASMSLVLGLKLMFDLRQDRREKKDTR
jgi:membrane-associated phospholipid phosphatase